MTVLRSYSTVISRVSGPLDEDRRKKELFCELLNGSHEDRYSQGTMQNMADKHWGPAVRASTSHRFFWYSAFRTRH